MNNLMNIENAKILINRIIGAKKIILTTHEGSDGDGIGSELAVYYALKKLKKEVYIINDDPLPKRFAFLDKENLVRIFSSKIAQLIKDANLILVLDASQYKRVGKMEKLLVQNKHKVFFIDHHIEKENEIKGITDDRYSSTAEMVYELINALKIAFDKRIAECLYSAILFDTHSFRYIRNDPNPLVVASELIKYGVNTSYIQEKMFATKSKEHIKLLSYVYSNLNFVNDGKIVWALINKEIIDSLNVERDEVRGIISNLIEIADVKVAILFKVFKKEETRVSFRSKEGVNVGDIAIFLGGGGHAQAAGVEMLGEPEDVIKKVLSCFRNL